MPASDLGIEIDRMWWALVGLTAFFSVLIAGLILFMCIRYREGSLADRTSPPTHHVALEVTWIGIPLLIVIGLFMWTSLLFLRIKRPPADAVELFVVGRQWMWKIQHPQGRREINTLHVPLGRPIKLTMTSQDVIHSFFIPAFRLKQDVVPGMYVNLWFTPTKVGSYHLFCTQYCGVGHAAMIGTVQVQEPSDYQRWLEEDSNPASSIVTRGATLFEREGCSACHVTGGMGRCPRLEHLVGAPVVLDDGRSIVADEAYIREKILYPERSHVAGYPYIMPSFRNRLNEEDVMALIEYIKGLGGGEQGRPDGHPERPRSLGELGL
jgi:cytochrome c oxidase subunit 2